MQKEGWTYLASVMELCSRKIIEYAYGTSMTADLTVKAVEEESPDIIRANDHGETDMYNHVLAQYSDMVRNNFYMVLRDRDTYESSFGEDIGVEIRTHKQDIYYTL